MRPALAWAIAESRWELAALCLLVGLLETLAHVPADSVEGLMDVLDGGADG